MNKIIISQTGVPYFFVDQKDQSLLISLHTLNRSPAEIDADLRQAGIKNYTGKNGVELRKRANTTYDHAHETVVEHIGWTSKNIFCDHLGNISTGAGTEAPKSAVMRQPLAVTSGTLEGWLDGVARPLTGNPTPIMTLSAALIPLLRPLMPGDDNLGLQIVGPPGTGKSTLLSLAQSLSRSPLDHAGIPTSLSATQFMAAPFRRADPFYDHLLPIDDLSICGFGGTKAKRQQNIERLLEQLIFGRLTDDVTVPHRFTFLLVGNESLVDQYQPGTLIALDRIPILRINPGDPHGVFTRLPEGVASGSQFADTLKQCAMDNFGHVTKGMVERLLMEASRDMRETLAKHRATFVGKLNVDLNSGSAVRRAEIFARAYAAGKLAQEYGLFPDEWKIGNATRDCYNRYEEETSPPAPFIERLVSAVDCNAFLEVPEGGLKAAKKGQKGTVTRKAIKQADGFLKVKEKQVEVWLRTERASAMLPRWAIDKKDGNVRAMMVLETDRLTVKRKVEKDRKPERVHVFIVPRERLDGVLEMAD